MYTHTSVEDDDRLWRDIIPHLFVALNVPVPIADAVVLLDDDLQPIDEESIDALVSDSQPLESERSDSFRQGNLIIPPVPPGLGFDHAHPPVQFGEVGSATVPAQALTGSAIVRPPPALPRPVTPVTPLKPKAGAKRTAKAESAVGSSGAKKTIQTLAAESGLSKDIAAQSSSAFKEKSVLQEEDFPALDSATVSELPKVTPALPAKPVASSKATQAKKAAAEADSKAGVPKSGQNQKAEKRPVPGPLDIAAATKTTTALKEAIVSAGADRPSDSIISAALKSVPSSAHPTPTLTAASVASPLSRAAPKTLRLVQTPKAELPPTMTSSAASSIRAVAIAAAHRPGTPASVGEVISDTASVVSASISASRTSSPPPSRIGAASTRATTKSQQRKQRKEASKEATAAIITEAKPVEQEVEVAPILGRKKKQKKEKREKMSAAASPAVSRPDTPVAHVKTGTAAQLDAASDSTVLADEKKPVQKGKGQGPSTTSMAEHPAQVIDHKETEATDTPKSPSPIDTTFRLNESTKTTVLTPDYVNPQAEHRDETVVEGAVGEVPSLHEILQSLIEEGELPDPDDIDLFKQVQNYQTELEGNDILSSPPNVKAVVTKEDEAELNAFRPVRKDVNGHRVLLTPNGDFILNLTEEEENRFLELQARLAKHNGLPTAFVAPKYTSGSGFSLIKGRAVPNGLPSFFPPASGSYPPDPIGKMHREEAIGCINQHVLPSFNLGNFKNNAANGHGGVNLQSLAPWINFPDSTNKGGRGFKLPSGGRGQDGMFSRMPSSDSPHEMWDDDEDDDEGPPPAIGSTPLMTVEEAESALATAKKQHDATDKKFRQGMARLRRQLDLH